MRLHPFSEKISFLGTSSSLSPFFSLSLFFLCVVFESIAKMGERRVFTPFVLSILFFIAVLIAIPLGIACGMGGCGAAANSNNIPLPVPSSTPSRPEPPGDCTSYCTGSVDADSCDSFCVNAGSAEACDSYCGNVGDAPACTMFCFNDQGDAPLCTSHCHNDGDAPACSQYCYNTGAADNCTSDCFNLGSAANCTSNCLAMDTSPLCASGTCAGLATAERPGTFVVVLSWDNAQDADGNDILLDMSVATSKGDRFDADNPGNVGDNVRFNGDSGASPQFIFIQAQAATSYIVKVVAEDGVSTSAAGLKILVFGLYEGLVAIEGPSTAYDGRTWNALSIDGDAMTVTALPS